MERHKDVLKLEHFQTSRASGDVDLLLGVERQSNIVQSNVAICLVRQPIAGQKLVILTGSTQDIGHLDGNIKSNIDNVTVIIIQNSHHR